ncbi:MAG: transposase [Acidobacteriota bacterium]
MIARGNERKAVFRDERDRQEYLDRLDRYRSRFQFSLYAYCLMSNHIHLAIEEGEVRLSRIMHGLQFSYTQWFNRRHRRVGHLFQGRFKSYLVDREEYLMALLRYIHENPVRAGMVTKSELYAWSSDRYFRAGRGPSWLDLDSVLQMLGPNRPAAVAAYRRLMDSRSSSDYGSLAAVERVVKGSDVFARKVLPPSSRGVQPRIGWTAERVGRCVAPLYALSFEDLCRRGQRRSFSKARIAAAYLGRAVFGIPVTEFARLFHREHSGLLHGVLSLERRITESSEARQELTRLERRICELADLQA